MAFTYSDHATISDSTGILVSTSLRSSLSIYDQGSLILLLCPILLHGLVDFCSPHRPAGYPVAAL
jgi:hypothetical protein